METINITLKLPKQQVAELEQFCRDHFENLLDFRILPDTERMYEEDKTYQLLCKAEKKAKTIKSKYINDNNGRYL